MKRPLFLVLFLATSVLLMGVISAGCSELGGTATTTASLSGDTTTSETALSSTPGQPTTTVTVARATATTAGPPATHAAAPTTLAPEPYFPPYVPTIRIEDEYTGLAWSGTWAAVGDPSDSGGGSRFAGYAGSSMKVYFTGTSISFITRKGPAVGYALLELDGVAQPIIDLYNPSWVFQQLMWSSGTIGSGDHTLKVTMVGDSHPASASKGIYVDAFDVEGTAR